MSLAECLMIAIVAILVVKPDQWPKLIQQLAHFIKQFKAITNNLQQQADQIIHEASLSEREQQAAKADELYRDSK